MDHCDECGFVYGDHVVEGVADELAALGSRYRPRLVVPAGDAHRDAVLRQRPESDVWSALEYACHVRDVLLAQRERLFLALVEDCPSFTPIYREQRVTLAGYGSEEPARVATEIGVAADLVARAFTGLDARRWARRCLYNFPTPKERSVGWLAQHTLHEAEHHLLDIDRRLALCLGDPQPGLPTGGNGSVRPSAWNRS